MNNLKEMIENLAEINRKQANVIGGRVEEMAQNLTEINKKQLDEMGILGYFRNRINDKSCTNGGCVWNITQYDECHTYLARSGSLYCVSKYRKNNYTTAQAFCERKAFRIASELLRNKDEMSELAKFKRNLQPYTSYLYVGLQYSEAESTWKYADGIIANENNTNWCRGYPPTSDSLDRKCGSVDMRGDGCIYSLPCNYSYLVLCERNYN